MNFTYELHKKAFAKKPETIFDLPHINKVLIILIIQSKDILTEQETNGKNIFKYHSMKESSDN